MAKIENLIAVPRLSKEDQLHNLKLILENREKKVENLNKEIKGLKDKIEKLSKN